MSNSARYFKRPRRISMRGFDLANFSTTSDKEALLRRTIRAVPFRTRSDWRQNRRYIPIWNHFMCLKSYVGSNLYENHVNNTIRTIFLSLSVQFPLSTSAGYFELLAILLQIDVVTFHQTARQCPVRRGRHGSPECRRQRHGKKLGNSQTLKCATNGHRTASDCEISAACQGWDWRQAF